MRLTHQSKGPWEYSPHVEYDNTLVAMKPRGLWLSVDGDWERWCEDEGMGHWVEGEETEFVITEPGRVLTLTTVEDILTFTDSFVADRDQYRLPWGALVEHWAGIMIAPYQWELRLDRRTNWYYSWDCASACIWDLSVIEVVP